jgi:WD40 repeat protein
MKNFINYLFKAVSVSDDKSIKVWDMGMHKVIKSWDIHTDSINSLFINENFSKILTGSKNGELYLTDLSRNTYSLIDKLENESIISIAMNQNFEIFTATDKSRMYYYVRN